MSLPVRPRLVLDTNIIVAALRSRRGASNALLRAVVAAEVVALATPALFFEYEAVLLRPEQRAACAASVEELGAFLDGFAACCEPVRRSFSWRPQLADADDELVLEAAVSGRADGIVTFNVRHLSPARHFGIAVLAPSDIMETLRRGTR